MANQWFELYMYPSIWNCFIFFICKQSFFLEYANGSKFVNNKLLYRIHLFSVLTVLSWFICVDRTNLSTIRFCITIDTPKSLALHHRMYCNMYWWLWHAFLILWCSAMTVEEYERTWEQNEELGLNDMDTSSADNAYSRTE